LNGWLGQNAASRKFARLVAPQLAESLWPRKTATELSNAPETLDGRRGIGDGRASARDEERTGVSGEVELQLLAGQRITLRLPPPGPARTGYFSFLTNAGVGQLWPFVKAVLSVAGQGVCDVNLELSRHGLKQTDVTLESLQGLLDRDGYGFGPIWRRGALPSDFDRAGRPSWIFARDPREAVAEDYGSGSALPAVDFVRSSKVADAVDRYAYFMDFCRARRNVHIFRSEEAVLGWGRLARELAESMDLALSPQHLLELAELMVFSSQGKRPNAFWRLCDAAAGSELEAKLAAAVDFFGYGESSANSPADAAQRRESNRASYERLSSLRVDEGARAAMLDESDHGGIRIIRPLREPDPELYSRHSPNGLAEMTVLGRRIVMETDANACRPVKNQPDAGEKTVAIYGCSFTFGEAVNLDETFCSRLQALRPTWRVENHGVSGYGGYHNLIQLERDSRWTSSDYITFCWIPDHLVRNVAAISLVQRLSRGMPPGKEAADFPRASLDSEGRLQRAFVKFPRRDLLQVDVSEYSPDPHYLDIVCAKILLQADQNAKQNASRFFVTILQGQMSAWLRSELENSGVAVLDASLNGEQYLCLPDDFHPNALAHGIYAQRIHDRLTLAEAS
jgi:hypothetical protein